MEKYKEEIKSKRFTSKMIADFNRVEAMEEMGCYHFKGITIIKEDCNFCSRKCRMKGD